MKEFNPKLAERVDSALLEFLKMTRDELLKMHEMICEKGRSLMRKKNADYAGNGGNEPFANFTRVESMGICSTEQGFLVRMTDKMSRLSSFVESGKLAVENESFEDTIIDVVNYAVLMYSYIHDKNTKEQSSPTFIAGVKSSDVVHTNGCCKTKLRDNGEATFFIDHPRQKTQTTH
jgi:hypothetical protein